MNAVPRRFFAVLAFLALFFYFTSANANGKVLRLIAPKSTGGNFINTIMPPLVPLELAPTSMSLGTKIAMQIVPSLVGVYRIGSGLNLANYETGLGGARVNVGHIADLSNAYNVGISKFSEAMLINESVPFDYDHLKRLLSLAMIMGITIEKTTPLENHDFLRIAFLKSLLQTPYYLARMSLASNKTNITSSLLGFHRTLMAINEIFIELSEGEGLEQVSSFKTQIRQLTFSGGPVPEYTMVYRLLSDELVVNYKSMLGYFWNSAESIKDATHVYRNIIIQDACLCGKLLELLGLLETEEVKLMIGNPETWLNGVGRVSKLPEIMTVISTEDYAGDSKL